VEETMTQQEKITNLLKLISEYPDLEILPMVDCEVGDSDYSRTLGEWGKAEVDYHYSFEERIYFKSHDYDELVEDFMDKNCDEEEYKNISAYEFEKIAESKVDAYEWTKAIIVNINPN